MPSSMMTMRTIGKVVSPIMMIFSIYLLQAGHNSSGGEFPAALMFALSIISIALTQSQPSALLSIDTSISMIVIGMSIAIINGFIGPLLGNPMFTQYHGYVDTLIGEIHLSTQYMFAYSLTLSISFTVILIIRVISSVAETNN
ncbi:MnhB domain-containing protein [Alkalicoccus luteus]|uniref:Na+/H+ antiporter MnhB subunit-related protein domain-containing protein n=1 Tax=Alkalicoccus luteus TaxID=1237094 RepID=A0A969PRU1_9BACI|nr:MnhB domain-containing protein [Alkalicoccus luteus]NJP39251.1 hypothetical protein [Alkalicoccus luteus]